MEYVYRPADWQVFYSAVAGVSAALTGLLFVALSVNLTLVRGGAHRARAGEALSGLLFLVVLAVIVLIPGQRRGPLGWEILVGPCPGGVRHQTASRDDRAPAGCPAPSLGGALFPHLLDHLV